MSIFLPIGGFRWLTPEQIEMLSTKEAIESLDDHGRLGFVFEVDLDIPNELHDRFNDLPPGPREHYDR